VAESASCETASPTVAMASSDVPLKLFRISDPSEWEATD
jgi:hypothetical protein